MKEVISKNNKHKLKYWFPMYLLKLGADFCAPKNGYRSQKRSALALAKYWLISVSLNQHFKLY